MPLDINGYNNAFRTFVDFAQKTHRDGYDSAAAKATLNERQLTVSALSLHETSYVLRKTAEKDSNDATRQIFRQAIIDMFGGESVAVGTFLFSAMLARCDDATIQDLRAALYSNNSGTVADAVVTIAFEGDVDPMKGDEEIFPDIQRLAEIIGTGFRIAIDNAVNNILGIEQFQGPPEAGDHELNENEVGAVYTAIKHYVPQMFPDGNYD